MRQYSGESALLRLEKYMRAAIQAAGITTDIKVEKEEEWAVWIESDSLGVVVLESEVNDDQGRLYYVYQPFMAMTYPGSGRDVPPDASVSEIGDSTENVADAVELVILALIKDRLNNKFVAMGMEEYYMQGKVVCDHAHRCMQECGAKEPHLSDCCEPCPFDRTAKCVDCQEGK